MKKLLSLFIMVVFALTVAACTPSKPKVDTTIPVIEGAESIEINVGDTIDLRAGVTARDDVDGVLPAESITIEGTVNTERAGTYSIVYKVKDSAGNEATKTRIVIVNGLAGFVNGDFKDGLAGWETWTNKDKGAMADFEVVNEVAVIDVTASPTVKDDNNWWDIQIKQKTLTLKKFESYTLKFTVKAEHARKMNVQLQGGGLSNKPIGEQMLSLTTEEQTFSFNFFAKEDTSGTELQFAFGSYHAVSGVPAEQHSVLGKIYLSNVEIVSGPELENQAPILTAPNVLLPIGAAEFILKSGVTVVDDRDNLTLNDITIEDITVGEKFSLPAKKGVYTFKFTVKDSGGITVEKTRNVIVAAPFDLQNGNFADVNAETGHPVGWTIWHEATRGGLNVTVNEGVVAIDITKIGTEDKPGDVWDNQFKYTTLAAFKGSYTLSFEIWAETPRKVRVAMEAGGVPNLAYTIEATSERRTVTIDFEIEKDGTAANRSLQFWFGNLAKIADCTAEDNILTTVYIANVQFIKK